MRIESLDRERPCRDRGDIELRLHEVDAHIFTRTPQHDAVVDLWGIIFKVIDVQTAIYVRNKYRIINFDINEHRYFHP